MPVTSGVLNHNINALMRGVRVEFWINPTIAADGTVAVTLDSNGNPVLAVGTHPNAKNIGYSQDGGTLTRTKTFEDLPVDQEVEPVGDALISAEAHFKFTMLQVRDYDVLAALESGLVAVTGTGFKGIADGSLNFSLFPIACISPLPNDATKYQVLVIYAAKNGGNLDLKLAKQYNKTPIDLLARPAGRADNRTFFAYETTA